MNKPEKMSETIFETEVCVPVDWNRAMIEAFANGGDPEIDYQLVRVTEPCAMKAGYQHVTLKY